MSDYTSYDLVEWGKPFEKRRRPLPDPKGLEVLVRVTAAGLCHSDLYIKKGHMDLGEEGKLTFSERGARLPMTFGHEVAGYVEAVGKDVKSVTHGQQVLVFPWIGCGACLACREDRQSDCLSMRVIGMVQNGGFATHCLVEHEKFLIDIEGLDATEVAPHACSGSTTYNALVKVGELREGEWLAVMGCGGLGMNAIALACGMGFENVIAIDIDDTKLATALEMGASKIVNSRRKDAVEELQRQTDGRLMGVVDTFGGAATSRIAVRAMSKAARYVVVGQAGGDFRIPQVWLTQKGDDRTGQSCGRLAAVACNYRHGACRQSQADAGRTASHCPRSTRRWTILRPAT